MSRLRAQTLRGSLWTLISTGANLPMAVLTTVVLARAFTPSELGRFALLNLCLFLALWLATAGVPMALQRRLSLAHGASSEAAAREILRMEQSAAALHMLAMLVVSSLVLTTWRADALMLAYAVVAGVTGPAAVYLTATNQGAFMAQTALASATATSVVQVIVAPVTHNPDIVVASGFLAGALSYLALLLGAGKRELLFPGWAVPRLTRTDWRFGLMTLAGGQITNLVFSRTELFFFPRSMSFDRGRFAAGTTVGSRATLLIDSLFGSIAPALTTLYGRAETAYRDGVSALFRLSSALFIALFPGTLVSAVVLTPYVFPSAYGDLRWWVLPLLVVSLLQTGVQPILSTWTAGGRAGAALGAGLIAAAVDIALSAALVPHSGMHGAVVANCAAATTYVLLAALLFQGHLARPAYARYWLTVVTAAGVGGVMAAAEIQLTAPREPLGLLAIPAAALVSLAMLAIARPLRAEDLGTIPGRVRGTAARLLVALPVTGGNVG